MIKVYEDLGWESLSERRHFRRLSMFYQIQNGLAPTYLVDRVRDTAMNITKIYSNSFFPYCNTHWNNIDASIKEVPTLSQFKNVLLKKNQTHPEIIFQCDWINLGFVV